MLVVGLILHQFNDIASDILKPPQDAEFSWFGYKGNQVGHYL